MRTLRPGDFLQPELTALNRLPMRAPLPFHDTAFAALEQRRPRRRRSLDGDWAFELFESPDEVPLKWPANPLPDQRTSVPGCWTMDPAIDDWPHYTNIIMPWPGLEAPDTPERNPVGCYSTTIDLPAAWLRDDLVLHLGGFESVAAVWCNGSFVGMGKDSRLAAEFLLNEAAVAGENRLDIMVIRYSDATWIEDQDHWWHGGLHRSVFIEARPTDRIDDLSLQADFDPTTRQGLLHIDAGVCGRRGTSVQVSVYADAGAGPDAEVPLGSADADVPTVPTGPPLQQLISCYLYPGRVASLDLTLDDVAPWTAETPTRYRVVAELLDPTGRTLMATAAHTGFRRIEVRDRRFLVNGTPIVFHGVNRHDHHPTTGKVQTVEDLRADLETMRAHNIDAIRCAHYPNDPVLLDLCDELGMWVVDEANIECHARLRSLADDPRYTAAMLDRVSRMVVRDRNHPSVVMWSLGNESGHGVTHDALAAWVRATDPSRPLHYEGAVQRRFVVEDDDPATACRAPSARERAVTDVVCPMYASSDVTIAWAEWAERTQLDDRPLVLCEYSHAMGNSNGGFDRYAEAFHTLPALAGGFVWDWRDQGLSITDDDGRSHWGYGGHFDDAPNDANFCINGVVGPDGTPHPGLHEVAWGYQPVRVVGVRGRTVRIANRRAFRSLADLEGTWILQVDGAAVEHGPIEVEVAPATTRRFDVPFTLPLPRRGDVQLQFRWCRRHDGHVVGVDEVILRTPETVDLAVIDEPELQGVGQIRTPVSGAVRVGSTSVVCRADGVHDLVVGGRPATAGLVAPTLWRAPTDNDGVSQGWMSEVQGVRLRWLALGLDQLHWQTADVQVLASDDRALVLVDRSAAGAWAHTRFVLRHDSITVDACVRLDEAWSDPPRIGTRLAVPAGLAALRWFGRGRHESYPDRKASTPLGVWASTVDEQYHPYVVPQEHGAHADTRWFELLDDEHHGLRFTLANPLSFSARRHDDDALTAATTTAELEPGDTIDVHIDAAHRGLGTGACGPDTARDHRIGAGEHRWRYTITEVSG